MALSDEYTCFVGNCQRPFHAKGFCKSHYTKVMRTPKPRQRTPPLTLVMRRVEVVDSGCWEWTGPRSELGYGRAWIKGEKRTLPHRIVYEEIVGPIPDGLSLDHLCRNPPCCNPAHLEPVTLSENSRRAAVARSIEGWASPSAGCRQTHCKRGHEFTPENTRVDNKGSRGCRLCAEITRRARRQAARAARST